MRPVLALLGLSVLALLTTACSSGGGASSNPTTGVTDLKGTHWTVDTVGAATTIAANPPTIAFGADGNVSGTTGCNTYSGTYKLDGAKITIGPIASTRMACEGAVSAQEFAFTDALQNAAAWSVGSDGKLTLTGPATPEDEYKIVASPAAA